jgi:hypothetical protein
MRTLVLKTVEDYHRAHQILWTKIINYMKQTHQKFNVNMKYTIFKKIWGDNIVIKDHCFGCEYSSIRKHWSQGRCNNCFFDINQGYSCLNGIYNKLTDKDNSFEQSIALARKIKDFPIKK